MPGRPSGRSAFPASSEAVVMQRTRRWRTRDAGDGAEVFVNGAEVMVAHASKGRPWHDLEKSAVEWRREHRVELIRVYSSPDGMTELNKRIAPDRQPSLVRRQVAGDDVCGRSWSWVGAEVSAATQVGRG